MMTMMKKMMTRTFH